MHTATSQLSVLNILIKNSQSGFMIHESLTGNSPREPEGAPLLLTTYPWNSRGTFCLTLLAEPHAHADSQTETPIHREEQHWKKNMEEAQLSYLKLQVATG